MKRQIRERGIGNEFFTTVRPMQFSTGRVGRWQTRVDDRGADRVAAEDARQVLDEIADTAAAGAPVALGVEDFDPALGEPPQVRQGVLDVSAFGLHRPQVVERTSVETDDVGRIGQSLDGFRRDHLLGPGRTK